MLARYVPHHGMAIAVNDLSKLRLEIELPSSSRLFYFLNHGASIARKRDSMLGG